MINIVNISHVFISPVPIKKVYCYDGETIERVDMPLIAVIAWKEGGNLFHSLTPIRLFDNLGLGDNPIDDLLEEDQMNEMHVLGYEQGEEKKTDEQWLALWKKKKEYRDKLKPSAAS